MKLFARSTADSLASTRQALAGAEAKIVELETLRSDKLFEADTIAEVQRIDSELATQRHAASIYRDRIVGLIERQRQEERDRLEQQKSAKIAEMSKRLARRDDAAQILEAALTSVRKVYAELLAADEAIFPAYSGFNYLSITSVAQLRRDRRPSDPMPRTITGPVRAIADGAGTGLAEEIQQKGVDLIEIMSAEPIEFDDVDESNEVAA
jgi:predicted RNase H-like nuclease (RuvC/YqgF family)